MNRKPAFKTSVAESGLEKTRLNRSLYIKNNNNNKTLRGFTWLRAKDDSILCECMCVRVCVSAKTLMH